MGIRTLTTFESYTLTPEEFQEGSKLTELQRQYLHNLRTDAALEKLNLTFNPENLGRDAELQGQIGIISLLLQNSEEAYRET